MGVLRKSGELDALAEVVAATEPTGTYGIGHTRWSTHGPPNDRNAHPHTDETGQVAVVHNGIIENYAELKAKLQETGVTFTSDTDTEVVPHLIAQALDASEDPETAFHNTVDRLEGSYAIAAIIDGSETIYAARQGSPLVVGVGDDCTYLASDVPAFVDHTRDVVFLEDGHRVIATKTGYTVLDGDREPVDVDVETVSYTAEATGKSGYDHYMLKEIHEQPTALRQCFLRAKRCTRGNGHPRRDRRDPTAERGPVRRLWNLLPRRPLRRSHPQRDGNPGRSLSRKRVRAVATAAHARNARGRYYPKRRDCRHARCAAGRQKPRCQHARAHQHSQLDGRPRV